MTAIAILALLVSGLHAPVARGAGGCGSVCLPLEAVDPEKAQLDGGQLRVMVTTEWANFNNFREGKDSVANPGGARAKISQTTLFIGYGLNERLTVSALVPYIVKRQKNNKFGKRVADGFGDPSLFGSYELIPPELEKSFSVAAGLGLKFPLGSLGEPSSSERLPPAFQIGSGAFDLIPTISYYHDLDPFKLFGSALVKLPLEENRRGYRFGNEYELNAGGELKLPVWQERLSLLLSLSYLYAEHDRDSEGNVPAKLLSGRKVLNSGGQFLDVVPGLRLHHGRFASQLRVFIPVIENWNGQRATNVGQVAPDWTAQVSLIFEL